MGFVSFMNNALFAPFPLLKEERLKKSNTDGVEKGISNDDLSFSL